MENRNAAHVPPWMRKRRVRAIRTIAVVMVLAGTASFYGSTRPARGSTLGGTATFADVATGPLTGPQPSTQAFVFQLSPSGACSGDSATGGYHWFSFLEAPGTDLASLTLVNGLVSPGNGLYDNTSSSGQLDGNNHNTEVKTGNIPIATNPSQAYSWRTTQGHVSGRVLIPSGHTTASYLTGIACFDSAGKVSDYWAAGVTFAGTSSAFTWTPTVAPSSGTTTTTGPGATTTSALGQTTTSAVGGDTTTTAATTASTTSSSTTTGVSGSSSQVGAAGVAGGSGTSPSSGGTGGISTLPVTGSPVGIPAAGGVGLIAGGILLLGIARRQAEVERLAWPE